MRHKLASRQIILIDDFLSYADDATIQAVYAGVSGTPVITRGGGGVLHVENGAAAQSIGVRTVNGLPRGKRYRLTAVCSDKTASIPRFFAGSSSAGVQYGGPIMAAVGMFSFSFIMTSAQLFIGISTNSSTSGQYVEINYLKLQMM